MPTSVLGTGGLTRRIGAQRPRLSLIPETQVKSAASEAIALANSCGMMLDDWQEWCLGHMLGERADGSWSATQSVLIVPRQAGKSALFEVIELAGLFLFGESRIIHSAHLAKAAADHMARMVSLITANPELESLVKFYFANGKERIERTDTGATLEFVTRGQKTLRGGSPQRLVFDEALFLTDEQMQAMLPGLSAQSMSAEGSPQFMFGSSAPLAASSVLHRLRRHAMTGTAKAMFYAEWSCEQGVDPYDRDAWYSANPGMGIRISEEWVEQNELAVLSPEAFLIERLGVVFGEDATSSELPEWGACLDVGSQLVGVPSFAVDVAPDLSWSSIGVAGERADGLTHLEVVQSLPGTAQTVDALIALWNAHRRPIALDPRSPAAGLLPGLVAAGVEVVEVGGVAASKACAALKQAVANGTVRHRGQGPLDVAVKGAAVRAEGDAWKWARRTSAVDISPLVAVTLALAACADGLPPGEPSFFNLADFLDEE